MSFIPIVDNILQLRSQAVPADSIPPTTPPTTNPDKDHIYIKGYYHPGDGGDGLFIYDRDSIMPDVGGIYLRPNAIGNDNIPGRWVRQYSGHINVIYFGVVKNWDPWYNTPSNTLSNAIRIQAAIDFAQGFPETAPSASVYSGDLTLYFPDGTYYIDDTIVLREATHIKGDTGTLFYRSWDVPKPFDYMFKIDSGYLNRLCVENLSIEFFGIEKGNTTGGFLIEAQASNLTGSGLWSGIFRNIRMKGVNGHGIFLSAHNEVDAGTKFNQYLYFENIWIERTVDTPKHQKNCLRMEGAQVNLLFTSCQFAIPYQNELDFPDAGTNIYITCPVEVPYFNCQIAFINCAIGGGNEKSVTHCCKIENAQNITFENCWFEDSETAISIIDSKAINILNSRFANAAGHGSKGKGDHKGECILAENSYVTVERNFSTVSENSSPYLTQELFIRGSGSNSINLLNNSFNSYLLSDTYGITQYVTIKKIPTLYFTTSPNNEILGIQTEGKKFVLVMQAEGPDTNDIFRINSTIGTGELLILRAEEKDFTIWAWDIITEIPGRNIYLSGKPSIKVLHGQCITFTKTDGLTGHERCAYQLISIV